MAIKKTIDEKKAGAKEKKTTSAKKTATKKSDIKNEDVKDEKKAPKTAKKTSKKEAESVVEKPKKAPEKRVLTPEELESANKLKLLYELQVTDSSIDKIKVLRGELPLEVQDLEDEIAGLDTRMQNYQDEIKELEKGISDKKNNIANSKSLLKKYDEQQKNVRNNREYDSLSKEIEFQNLDIELNEKKIKEANALVKEKKSDIEDSKQKIADKKIDLENKKKELDDIIAETEKEEKRLTERSEKLRAMIEPRLLSAYTKIRANARNGLAVVSVKRDACGGCFNKIPPQRQLDIKLSKKVIVCEYCGRILVDSDFVGESNE